MRKAFVFVVTVAFLASPGSAAADEKKPGEKIDLVRLVENEARLLVRAGDDAAGRQIPKRRPSVKCETKKQGVILGAVIGAAAGAAFAIVIDRGIGYGGHSAPVQKSHVLMFGSGGAGIGALVGLGMCGR
jgi:hypothetical protein